MERAKTVFKVVVLWNRVKNFFIDSDSLTSISYIQQDCHETLCSVSLFGESLFYFYTSLVSDTLSITHNKEYNCGFELLWAKDFHKTGFIAV